MRTISALITATALVAVLASCSAAPGVNAACEPAAGPGKASPIVTADGAFGADPAANFPLPLIASDLEISVLGEGGGDVVRAGDVVDVQATLYEGSTGNAVSSSGYDPASPLRAIAGDEENIFGLVTECMTVGSRVIVATDAQAISAENPKDTPVVLVLDIVARFMGKANGADQLPVVGMPAVVLAPNGQPGIVIPKIAAPTDLKVAILKQGDGDVVAEGDSVVMNYVGMLWGTSAIFDSSWTDGIPATLPAARADATGAGGLIEGFATALIGQTVGSQVIVVIPPALGYGETGTDGVPAGATLVFVFDVLGIQK